MNAKDAIITKKKKKVERVEAGYVHHPEQGPCPKKAKVGEKRDRDGRIVLRTIFQLHSLKCPT